MTGVAAGDSSSIRTLKFEPRDPGQKRADNLAPALGVEYRPDREDQQTNSEPERPHRAVDDPPRGSDENS